MSYNSYMLKQLVTKEHIIELLSALGAHGINSRDSNGIRSSCPIHQSNGSTVFTYNPERHIYVCYGDCNESHKEGDFISLVKNCQSCDYDSAIEYICEVCNIDIKLIQSSAEFMLEEIKLRIGGILTEISNDKIEEENREWFYGVKPVDESVLQKFLGNKDEYDFIDNLGFSDEILELFESAYNDLEERWLLPIRSPEGDLLGFDGRDVTNKKKDKWRKRKGLLKNLLLGRLDIVGEDIIKENKIMIVEGKKDQMAGYEAGIKHTSCIYGSSLSNEQKIIIDSLIDGEIIICPDGDKSGYKMVQSIVTLCYPEYEISVLEIPDYEDIADLSKKYLLELYGERMIVEEWLKKYEYRLKQKKG